MHYNRNFLNTTFTYVNGVQFEAAPYFGGNRNGSIFYDRTNKRIVSYEWASPAWATVNASCYETSEESALEGYDLVCMQDRSNGTNTIVVVKDEAEALSILREVGRRHWDIVNGKTDGNGCTVWSALYNLTDKTVTWVSNEQFDNENAVFHFSL